MLLLVLGNTRVSATGVVFGVYYCKLRLAVVGGFNDPSSATILLTYILTCCMIRSTTLIMKPEFYC